MDSAKRNKLIVRWSMVTAGLIALFWISWYLVSGSVPVATSIRITPNWTVALPFSISRWWDVLIGPIWSSILILFFTNKQVRKGDDLVFGLVSGLGYGLVFGLVKLVQILASKNFWAKIGDWLLVRN